MRIGLYNIESKIINTALMKISSYHKNKGDDVEWCALGRTYDKRYASSIFDFTDKSYMPDDVIRGGSGFDLTTQLPPEIEDSPLDYSIYPNLDYSILKFSDGCIRKCPYCVVPIKEGEIRPIPPKNLNPKGTYIKVVDNNFFASPSWKNSVLYLMKTQQRIYLSQGIDIRILNTEHILALRALHFLTSKNKQIKFAWDNPKECLEGAIDNLIQYIKPCYLMCYVLIGYWSTPEEDLHRVMFLKDRGVDPYVMPYDKSDVYQKRFAKWCNSKPICNSVAWERYK